MSAPVSLLGLYPNVNRQTADIHSRAFLSAHAIHEGSCMSDTNADHNLSFLRHEIANILMTVRGYAELMLLREGLDPAIRRYPEQIIMAVDRATHELEQRYPVTNKTSYVAPSSSRAGA